MDRILDRIPFGEYTDAIVVLFFQFFFFPKHSLCIVVYTYIIRILS